MAKAIVAVEGLRQLGENLKTLEFDVKKKMLKSAAGRAARIVAKQAKQNVVTALKLGDEPLHIRDAIKARYMSKKSRPGLAYYAVGVFKIGGKKYANTAVNRRKQRVGQSYEVDPPEFYWKFHEFGAPGRNIPQRAFLVPAFDSTKARLPNEMADTLRKGIDKSTRKMQKTIKP